MRLLNLFSLNTKNSNVDDIMATMIKVAFSGELVSDEVVNCIECEEAAEEHVPAIIFGLTRATASFLKSLESSGINAKRLHEEMLNIWLGIDDYDYFEKWIKELNERRLGIK